MTELQLKIRLVRAAAVLVGEIVVRGEAISLQVIAEIRAVPGVDLAGELPVDC